LECHESIRALGNYPVGVLANEHKGSHDLGFWGARGQDCRQYEIKKSMSQWNDIMDLLVCLMQEICNYLSGCFAAMSLKQTHVWRLIFFVILFSFVNQKAHTPSLSIYYFFVLCRHKLMCRTSLKFWEIPCSSWD
jgi:hypothetical protein